MFLKFALKKGYQIGILLHIYSSCCIVTYLTHILYNICDMYCIGIEYKLIDVYHQSNYLFQNFTYKYYFLIFNFLILHLPNTLSSKLQTVTV